MRRLPVVVVATVMAACSRTTPTPAPLISPTAVASPSVPPPSLEIACGSVYGIHSPPMWLLTPDHVRLYAVESGGGSTVIVLAHEEGTNLCGWLPYMRRLNRAGIRALAVDLRGYGHSDIADARPYAFGDDLATAVARARVDGAAKVFLMGASMGGAAVVQNSAAIQVDGRVSLSGTRLRSGYGINDPKGVAGLRGPFLYVGSRDDFRAPYPEVLQIFARVGSRDKEKVLYPGSQHGWDLVEFSSDASRTRALILRWIRDHS